MKACLCGIFYRTFSIPLLPQQSFWISPNTHLLSISSFPNKYILNKSVNKNQTQINSSLIELIHYTNRYSNESITSISTNTSPAMADDDAVTIYNGSITTIEPKKNSFPIKVGLAQMLRNGAIIEVTNPEKDKIAKSTGSSCIIISDPFEPGRISRMSDPSLMKEIKNTVLIPIMAKSQVGHFIESQIIKSVGVEYVDESEVLSIADEELTTEPMSVIWHFC